MAEYAIHIMAPSRGGVFGHAESDREGDDAGPATRASAENGGGLAEEEIGCGSGGGCAAQAAHRGLQRRRGSYHFGESFHLRLPRTSRNKTRHRLRTAGEFHTKSGTPRTRQGQGHRERQCLGRFVDDLERLLFYAPKLYSI